MYTNLVDFLDQSAEKYRTKPALMFKPGFKYISWTYDELVRDSKKAAAYLAQEGLEKGDRVVIWAPNSPLWVVAFFGCLRAGVIVVPLDMQSSPEFVDAVISKTRPKLVLISRVTPADTEQIGVKSIYYEDLPVLYQQFDTEPAVQINDEDVAEVMFTSGTTGAPKGVMLTHKNLIANLNSLSEVITGRSTDRLISILPLSHMFEQMGGLLFPLKIGADITYAMSRRPKVLFRTMQERKVTVMLLVPQALDLFKKGIEREIARQGKAGIFGKMLSAAEKVPTSMRRLIFRRIRQQMGGKLRLIFAGGAALPEPVGHWWTLLGIDVIQGYGATEASPVVACHPEKFPRYDSPGPPLPGVEVRISDDGEVLVRGDNITPGYWEDEERTKDIFEGDWYKTGDQGLIDEYGFVRLNGRKKDMIVLPNGQNVFPEDVEDVLRQHEDVKDTTVLGMEVEDSVQVHAVVIMQEENSGIAEIINWANRQLASHQRIRTHSVWSGDDFPRTHTMKIKKPLVLEAILREGTGNEPAGIAVAKKEEEPAQSPLLAVLSELVGVPPNQIGMDVQLESGLGLDSLARVDLLSAIEEDLEVYVDDGDITPETTVEDLERLVQLGTSSDSGGGYSHWGLATWARLVRGVGQNLVLFPVIKACYRVEVRGLENFENIDRTILLVGNHCLHHDNEIYMRSLPSKIRRNLAIAAGAHMYNNPLRGAILTLFGNAFPFATGKAEKAHNKGNIRASMDNMGIIMDKGWSVMIYPEGELTVGGPMQPFLRGTGLMAIGGNLPVIPMYINIHKFGTPSRLPWFRRGRVTVNFGAPLVPPWDGTVEETTTRIEESVKDLAIV